MTVNYIISAYGGSRRNPGFYIKHQIDRLNRMKHNLSQVTIMWPEYIGQNNDVQDNYVSQLKNLDTGCPIKVIRTPNRKDLMSIYQFYLAFDFYGNEFDYSILTEDDGFPYLSKFDNKCIDLINIKNADLLFGHFHRAYGQTSVSTNIICKGNVFSRLAPISAIRGWHDFYNTCLQNLHIADMLPQYKVPIWGYRNFIVEYNPYGKIEMFVPWQWWDYSIPKLDYQQFIKLHKRFFNLGFHKSMEMFTGRLISKLELDGTKMKGPLHFDGHLGTL